LIVRWPSNGSDGLSQNFWYRRFFCGGVRVMTSLIPDAFYWARSSKHARGRATIVQVSTIFGKEPDYWTLAVPGSDQHHMVDDFEIIAPVELFDAVAAQLRIAAE